MKTCNHLKSLTKILGNTNKRFLFSCIKDLVLNGPALSRFSDDEYKPTRQDITQFMAAWFRYTEISREVWQGWLIEYCVDVLSSISSSSKSQIRHSTKSNVKYIYRYEVSFICGCEDNRLKAICEKSCPVYGEMQEKQREMREKEANRFHEPITLPIDHKAEDSRAPVKEIYLEQFEKALEFIRDNLKKGIAYKKIVTLLNEDGFKTRTGKRWKYPTLMTEVRKKDWS